MTLEEVAERAGVDPDWLADLERGVGLGDMSFSRWLPLVRATQPPRPEWWDEGHEHDLNLGPGSHGQPITDGEREYWRRIEAVRREIERSYARR